MNRFSWVNARSVGEAAAIASSTVADAMTMPSRPTNGVEVAILKAGGIDVLDLLKENLVPATKLVNLRNVPGLDAIGELAGGGLRIGALVTLAGLAAHPAIFQRYPALAAACASSASPELRGVATIGGNLLQRPRCWYFRAEEYRCLRKGGGHCFAIPGENQYHAIFDNNLCAIVHPSTAATALVALGATITLADAEGTTRQALLEEFFVAPDRDLQRENDLRPGEVLVAIDLPPLSASARMAHLKQGEKDSFDWPLADVAVVLDLPGGTCRSAAIVLGAAAPVPHRAKAAEEKLVGRTIDGDVAAEAARAAIVGATPLTHNAYKLPLFETLVRRAILSAATPA